MLCGDLSWKEIQKRGDVCTCVAGLLCCTVETNNTEKHLYSNKNFKNKYWLYFVQLVGNL